mmetsp:Transcript_66172/g.186331  ORF Transcript_66172/g.186331 Transcript_66172/m.186331 type:complete len:183 (+) Transcript_66172:67-615(+)
MDSGAISTVVLDDVVDWLEVDGEEPVKAVSADWSGRLVKKGGCLCKPAPVFFDSANAYGGATWGPQASGAIVVAMRGDVEFEKMALRAERAGALAVVVVDNQESAECGWTMALEDPHKPGPRVPAILVPRKSKDTLCSSGRSLQASIVRRRGDGAQAMKALQYMRIRGMSVKLREAHAVPQH